MEESFNNESLDTQILQLLSQNYESDYSIRDISKLLGRITRNQRLVVKEHVMKMVYEGIIAKNGSRFTIHPQFVRSDNQTSHTAIGTVAVSESGKSEVICDDTQEHIRITSSNRMHALEGDRVKIYIFPRKSGKKPKAQVTEIISRKKDTFCARVIIYAGKFMAVSDDPVIDQYIVIKRGQEKIRPDDKITVKIFDWPQESKRPYGEVMQVLGPYQTNESQMQSILFNNGFPVSFDNKALQQADNISEDLPEKECALREDFSDIMTFTIDPEDAKDFDDALSFEVLENKDISVGVHIADVSYYVKPDTPIDKQAYERGTSVYLVDRCVPMLPEKLCNNICSLKQDVRRFCFSVIFTFDKDSLEVKDYRIRKTVIKSDRRFIYDEVQQIIENHIDSSLSKNDLSEDLHKFCTPVTKLWDIADKMRKYRLDNGAINFNSSEYKFDLDENFKPLSVHLKESKQANWLVEEFMLLANKTVAKHVALMGENGNEKTFVYRVHSEPRQDRFEGFKKFIERLGYTIDDSSRENLVKSYNNLFTQVEGTVQQNMIANLALRTMSKAYYSIYNIGHYGLAFDYYTHFTSPIRRYPDLMVHRLLQAYINGEPSCDKEYYFERCRHCSETEKMAADAEHASVKYKQAEFLADKIDCEFDGEISGISKWGFYVTILENQCEGFVRITSLEDDIYLLDEENYRFIGQNHKRIFQIGQQVRIRITNIDVFKRKINFNIAEY